MQRKFFIYIFWVLIFIVGYYGFTHFLNYEQNPNQTPTSLTTQSGERIVELKANSAHAYLANGTINHQSVTFLLDTGATSVVVPEKFATKLNLQKGQAYLAQTANGSIKVYSTLIRTLTIGNITLTNIRASINPSEHSNTVLLGMSALRRLSFEHQNGLLILRQK